MSAPSPWRRLAAAVAEEGAAALVTVQAVAGSAPREAGARLVLRPGGGFHGTIGGGRLEFQALDEAARVLAAGRGPARRIVQVLGPDLGQCCGGRVTLLIETFDRGDAGLLDALAARDAGPPGDLLCRFDETGRVRRDLASPGPVPREGWREPCGSDDLPVLLFGAGHVGRALVLALAPLPVRLRWVDPRAEVFPPHVPANATPVRSGDPTHEVVAAAPGTAVLVMTHAHALDLAIVAAALARADLAFVGLIGSATKRARFLARLRGQGLAEGRLATLVCPIGLPGIADKAPAVIAASVAAQMMQAREARRAVALPRADVA